MHKRQLTVVGIVLVAVTIIFATVTFRQQAQDKTQSGKDEPTVVQRGQVTDKEREYSKEYKKLYSYRQGRKFSELIDKTTRLGREKEDIGIIINEPEFVDDPDAPVITAAQFLRKLSCNADVIIVGSVKSKSAHMTEDETFAYTEYDFLVKDILKNNSDSPIETGSNIEITRPGGVIKLDNRIIRVEDQSYKPLEMKKEYLLFLRFIPSTNGYMVASNEGDFVFENKSLKKFSTQPLPKKLRNGNYLQNLLSDVQKTVTLGCN